MKVEVNNLTTIKNYALKENVTTSYIYKLIKEKNFDGLDKVIIVFTISLQIKMGYN